MKRWRKLYRQQATFVCPYCLREYPLSEATRDHKIPRSRGGSSDQRNLVLCCGECNSQKGSLTPQEYAEWKRLEFIRNGGLSK
jgi:5-methylcytosine-specific restriction endonuclease McrA